MSRLHAIKAAQIAAAEAAGEANLYAEAKTADPVDNRAAGRARSIKTVQLAAAEKTGINPYATHDSATGNLTVPSASPNTIAHYQAAMQADLAQLSQLNDVVEKAKAKRTMLETYWPFVEAYLKNGDNYPNEIVVRVCIWLFDTLDIERGLNLAFVLIKQNQPTPAKFNRDLKTFVCDAMYDWASDLLKKEQSASPYLDTLAATLTADQWDVHPAVASKIYAMLAKHKLREGDHTAVVALCDLAEQVNPDGAGVKTLRKTATTKLETP